LFYIIALGRVSDPSTSILDQGYSLVKSILGDPNPLVLIEL